VKHAPKTYGIWTNMATLLEVCARQCFTHKYKLSEGRAIACSMCTWVSHTDCLVPPVESERLDAGFVLL
jgi:hypothetical protein